MRRREGLYGRQTMRGPRGATRRVRDATGRRAGRRNYGNRRATTASDAGDTDRKQN